MDVGRNEIKEALWKEDFRALFPDISDKITRFFTFPNCGKCFEEVYRTIVGRPEELKKYFGEDLVLLNGPSKTEKTPPMAMRVNSTRMSRPASPFRTKTVPIRRLVKIVSIDEAENLMQEFQPPRYKIESTALSGTNISFVILEHSGFNNKASATTTTKTKTEDGPTRQEIREALTSLRENAPKEALKHLDILERYLVPDPKHSVS